MVPSTNLELAGNATNLLFEGSIVVMTIYHAWNSRRLGDNSHSDIARNTSFVDALVQQGVVWILIIFVWTLEGAITRKLLRPSIVGVDSPLEEAIAIIFLCRFQLTLDAENETSSPATEANSTTQPKACNFNWDRLRSMLHRLEASIIEEFGDRPHPRLLPPRPRRTTTRKVSNDLEMGPVDLRRASSITRPENTLYGNDNFLAPPGSSSNGRLNPQSPSGGRAIRWADATLAV
ncbi:hypothetical protein M422DRAFT_34705 [Sphaerobolus stellatus SS14]|uniref:Uncharacterized protein n=1 Tax=Sphaerobolus stellatus (strain SS14) TaxID=990650 RepID=A0A0C9VCP7_SPHS4|nr:hypothetical protein M422DRAFT_34705 [Sphaerobolus stellatus SS14]